QAYLQHARSSLDDFIQTDEIPEFGTELVISDISQPDDTALAESGVIRSQGPAYSEQDLVHGLVGIGADENALVRIKCGTHEITERVGFPAARRSPDERNRLLQYPTAGLGLRFIQAQSRTAVGYGGNRLQCSRCAQCRIGKRPVEFELTP